MGLLSKSRNYKRNSRRLPNLQKSKRTSKLSELSKAGYFSRIGPGIVTGAADDDPSGIGTYSQTGAQFGYQFLWSAPFLLPFVFAIQEACARIALVTGHGLARVIKSKLPKWVLLLTVSLVAIANTVNIAADLSSMSAVIGMFVPLPQLVGVVLLAIGVGWAEIVIPYNQYARVLRWLCLSLLSYIAVLAVANVDWKLAWYDLARIDISFTKSHLAAFIAIAGTTISPYLFFWQAAEEAEESNGSRRTPKSKVSAMRGDVFAGMLVSQFVMFAIITTTAATLNVEGITQIDSPEQAAQALEPIAGSAAGVLFALGILGTGLLAVPVLAGSTAYAVSEAMGWRESLARKPSEAVQFYSVIAVSMVVAVALNFLGINPMRSLVVAALLNGLTAPVLMFVIWWLARDKKLLGKWVSPKWSIILVGAGAIMMALLPVLWLLAPN